MLTSAEMVEDDLLNSTGITLGQARTWFSMPDQVARPLVTHWLASNSEGGVKGAAGVHREGRPQAAAQPKASGSLSSSRLVTGETP